MAGEAPVIHFAGIDIRVNDQLRQRCGWCGAVLLDYDLTRVMVPAGGDRSAPATWPVGALVAVDGGMSHVISDADAARMTELPPESCARIDHAVTT